MAAEAPGHDADDLRDGVGQVEQVVVSHDGHSDELEVVDVIKDGQVADYAQDKNEAELALENYFFEIQERFLSGVLMLGRVQSQGGLYFLHEHLFGISSLDSWVFQTLSGLILVAVSCLLLQINVLPFLHQLDLLANFPLRCFSFALLEYVPQTTLEIFQVLQKQQG